MYDMLPYPTITLPNEAAVSHPTVPFNEALQRKSRACILWAFKSNAWRSHIF